MKILALSGFVPEQICDTVRFTRYTGDRNITHYCGYASDYISRVLNDPAIDGAVFPKTCDSARILPSYLAGSGKFCYQLAVPAGRTPEAVGYFAGRIKAFQQAVEAHYGIRIQDIPQRIIRLNERNRRIREIYDQVSLYSYADYLQAIHSLMEMPLAQQQWPDHIERQAPTENRVFLVGSFLSCMQIAREISRAGLTVVGDTLPESGRLLSAGPVDPAAEPYRAIAENILSRRLSPTQNDFREILTRDLSEIRTKKAKGVVFVTQKYCEPYDYLYAAYKKELDLCGIPSVKISPSHSEDPGKALLLLETFADMLKGED